MPDLLCPVHRPSGNDQDRQHEKVIRLLLGDVISVIPDRLSGLIRLSTSGCVIPVMLGSVRGWGERVSEANERPVWGDHEAAGCS